MPRKRMIDPQIWTSEDFGTLSDLAQVYFIGMISNCDDEGRFKGSAAFLKATVRPYSADTLEAVEGVKAEIADKGMVKLYHVENVEFAELPSFGEFQYIQRPKASKFPGPGEADADPLPGYEIAIAEVSDTDPIPITEVSDTDHSKKGKEFELNRNKPNLNLTGSGDVHMGNVENSSDKFKAGIIEMLKIWQKSKGEPPGTLTNDILLRLGPILEAEPLEDVVAITKKHVDKAETMAYLVKILENPDNWLEYHAARDPFFQSAVVQGNAIIARGQP